MLVAWPFSTGVLVKLAAFLSSLTWPTEVVDLGLGEVYLLSSLFSVRNGRVKGSVWSFLSPNIGGLGVLFRCRLHLFAPALI